MTKRLRKRIMRPLAKQLIRTMVRLEHGHGPGTLTAFGGTYLGYDWKYACGWRAEW